MSATRVALAVNPRSGMGRGLHAGRQACARLRAAGVAVEELIGTDAPDLRRLIRRSLGTGPDALVVVGGDGMVHFGVNEVAGTPVPLGIIPAGTGNDFARALGLPLAAPGAAAEVVLRGLDPDSGGDSHRPANPNRRTLDAVRCTSVDGGPGRWFAGVLCAGFDALVNERANRWTRPRGRARYVLALLRELPVFAPRNYQIELDGERWVSGAMLVAVANGPSYGGGMRISPAAELDDGLLDVVLLEPMSRAAFLSIFPRVYSGGHIGDPRVVVRRGRRVSLDAPGIVAYADGERIGPLPLVCELVPSALVVLAGQSRGERR